MDKRLPLALFLSFLVLMAWSLFVPRPPAKVEPAGAGAGERAADQPGPGLAGGAGEEEREPALGAVVAAEAEETFALEWGGNGERGHFRAVFTNRGARLLELRLGDFFVRQGLSEAERADSSNWVDLLTSVAASEGATGSLELEASESARPLLRGTALGRALWVARELPARDGRGSGVEFEYAPGSGVTFFKRVRAVPGTYELEVELALRNDALEPGVKQFRFTPALCVPRAADERFYQEPRAGAAWGDGGDLKWVDEPRRDAGGKDPRGSLSGSGAFGFAGVHNKYFGFLLHAHPDDDKAARAVQDTSYRRVKDGAWAAANPGQEHEAWKYIACDLALTLYLPERGQTETRRFVAYAGPKDRDELVEAWPAHIALIDDDLGWFSGIAKVILAILGFYQGLVGNWGWAIIMMTLTVRLLLFPINRRSQTAMARHATKMKRVQPRLNELKERFKNDPKRQREEQAKIFQEEQLFPPLGGCLPMFLQFPVFIGLFQALRVDFDLRQSPFALWIDDLSMPDRLLDIGLDTHLPFIGTIEYLNVLPIVMVVLMVVQFRSMPTPTDEQQARMQKMMQWMPILFGVMLYSYAAGLSLYMITSSGLGLFETKGIKRWWPVDDSEKPRKKSRFLGRLADMQKRQMRHIEEQQRRGQGPGKGGGKGKGGKSGRRRP